MLLALARYKLPFELLAAFALLAGLLYGFHEFCERERDIGRNEIRAEWDKASAAAKLAAEKREKELQGQVAEAVDKGNNREQTIRTLAAANGAAAVSLRDTSASIRSSLPSLSGDALRAVASAYGGVLAECESRRGEVAEIAERLNSEKQTLMEAWPKNQP